MKKRIFKLLAILAISSQTAFSQEKPNNVLITIDDNQITKEEFVRIYKKNNQNTIDQKSIEEYLELFINFKLKVIEAEDKGLDTLNAFKQELRGYRQQLAKKYFSNEELEKQLIKESYERMQSTINISHIYIKTDKFAAPSDTLIAYNKALSARKRLLNGEEFEKVAKEISEDKNVIYNKGNVGYISAFKKPYSYETAVYSLKKNEISMPVRTMAGYHIIRVNKIIKSSGRLKVAHIALAAPKTESPLVVDNTKNEILKMYDSIQKGADFGEMAKKHSIDRQSASKGGELPWFEPGTFVPEFEELCFDMKKPGDMAGPVRTYFGWHIMKLIDIEPTKPFEEIEKELTKKIKQDPERKELIERSVVERIKKENGFEAYPSNIEPFYALVDSLTYVGIWDKAKGEGLNDILFSIGKKDITQQDFNNYISNTIRKTPNIPLETLINNLFDKLVKEVIIGYEDSQLENKHTDFRHLMKEYHDGILLFELTDQMVWSKAIKDTVGLEDFYNKNKNKYMWGKRAVADIYTCDNNDYANAAKKLAAKKVKKGYSNKEIIEKICEEDAKSPCIKIEHGKFEKDDNKLIEQIIWEVGLSEVVSKDDKFAFAYIIEIQEPQTKLFNEAKGIVTADYQDVLEKEWISELRNKHTIEVNKKLLLTIE